MKRFYGTIAAFVVLVLVGGVYLLNQGSKGDAEELQPEIFQFEAEQLVGIKVVRPDQTIEVKKEGVDWKMVGHPWRPSASMIRRVSHQLHDLTARAVVAEVAGDFKEYGLGDGSIQVTLVLQDGSSISFEAGDPNPTSVSWYLRPMPGNDVFVVKKSAIDYFRLDLAHFREKRVSSIDANEAQQVVARIGDRTLEVVKTGTKSWEMRQPVMQRADRQKVRTMLGRTGALKALEFVADAPDSLEPWGLANPPNEIEITLSGDRVIPLSVGAPFEKKGQIVVYVHRKDEDAVYLVKGGFLDAFQKPIGEYKDTIVFGHREWNVSKLETEFEGKNVAIHQSTGGWRWPDDSPISGSTGQRFGELVTEVKALRFLDAAPKGTEFGSKEGTIQFTDGEDTFVLKLGPRWEIPPENEHQRAERKQYLQVEGHESIYEIEWGLSEVLRDLHREYGRKLERDAEKRLHLEAADETE